MIGRGWIPGFSGNDDEDEEEAPPPKPQKPPAKIGDSVCVAWLVNRCPFCGADRVVVTRVERFGQVTRRSCRCKACHRVYRSIESPPPTARS